ncbi:MAG: hypothetical protein AAGA30_09625, partial [Planctomycetota bacterium]
ESLVEENVLKEHLVRTNLLIERVIKGELNVGEHPVMVGFAIGWSDDSPTVASYTSTEMIGDANATDSNIWFLKRKASRVAGDRNEYLFLDSYRGVQPLTLERYFNALRSERVSESISQLLSSKNPELVVRSLRYICGDNHPSSLGTSRLVRGKMQPVRKPLVQHSGRVFELINTSKSSEVRRMACWAYADLQGEEATPKMSEMLEDKDPFVQAIAVTSILGHSDWQFFDKVQSTVGGIEDSAGTQLVRFFSELKDARATRLLIAMLQTNCSDRYGWLTPPGVLAQTVLRERTGFEFPFDVDLSLRAWDAIESADNELARSKLVKVYAEKFATPLVAELVGDKKLSKIRIKNISKKILTISRLPSSITIRTPRMLSSGSDLLQNNAAENRINEISLRPNESTEFQLRLDDDYFVHSQKDRSIELDYTTEDRKLNLENWAGKLLVKVGGDWKEPANQIKNVVERWPNGNLRKTGKLINGHRTGEWLYFNENGDLIRSESDGTISKHNPDHPANRGRGKKK